MEPEMGILDWRETVLTMTVLDGGKAVLMMTLGEADWML